MERRDWLLITISAGQDSGLTPVQLQKSLFLLGQNFSRDVGRSFYKFIPYNYGPFSFAIYRDADTLGAEGLVEIRRGERRWPEYVITASGRKQAKDLRAGIDQKVRHYIENMVNWIQNQSFPELIRAIYEAYPQFKANSVFQE